VEQFEKTPEIYRPQNEENQMKRLVDMVCAGLALAVLFPLILLLAVTNLLIMGRPIFYVAQRAGKGGKPFRMLKFRSMTNATDPSGRPLPDEERITPYGKFLRRTSLDELPQLLNILKGDMSFVGPRPLPMTYIARYSTEQKKRLQVRPGLTGLCQVRYRGSDRTWSEKLALDVDYVERQSLFFDAYIILLTLLVLGRRLHGNRSGLSMSEEFIGNN
jgi:lipopolysaccharide/colanic/teichoic acid biosynthesis glycosyltransferase